MIVVHCQRTLCTHYCGRATSLNRAKGNPIDLSILGNPFWYIKGRDKTISAYAEYVLKRIKTDDSFKQIIMNIPSDAKLGCFCAPLECHCNIIELVSKYLKQTKNGQ